MGENYLNEQFPEVIHNKSAKEKVLLSDDKQARMEEGQEATIKVRKISSMPQVVGERSNIKNEKRPITRFRIKTKQNSRTAKILQVPNRA